MFLNSKSKKTKSDQPPKKKGKGNPEMVKRRPKLRTAHDVIHRVMWDPSLDKEHYTVGYLDRFIGIIERKFSSFNFVDDIATFDIQESFAIPQHRVQYIKYKGEVAWDKNELIDHVFGSSGASAMKISKFQAHVDEKIARKEEREKENDAENETPDFESPTATQHPVDSIPTLEKTKPKRVYRNNDRPNYFLCVRVFDKQARSRAEQVQSSVRSHLEHVFEEAGTELDSALLPTKLMHITMLVLRLNTQLDVERAAEHLKTFELDYPSALPIPLVGAHNFRDGRVVYTRPQPGCQATILLHQLQGRIRDHMMQLGEGVVKDEGRNWYPHVTITKMGRAQCRALGNNAGVPEESYRQFEDASFGSTRVLGVHLCPMGRPGNDSFYPIVGTSWNSSPYVRQLVNHERVLKYAVETVQLAKIMGRSQEVNKLDMNYSRVKGFLDRLVSMPKIDSDDDTRADSPSESTTKLLETESNEEKVYKLFSLLRQTAKTRYNWLDTPRTEDSDDCENLCAEITKEVSKNKTLLVIRGISGSGKSSFCSTLTKYTKTQANLCPEVCSADDFFSKWKFSFSPLLLSSAHHFCAEKVLGAIEERKQLIIIDNTHVHRWEYADALMMGVAAGYAIRIVEVTCPTEAFASMFATRNQHGVPKQKVMEMFARFEKEPITNWKLFPAQEKIPSAARAARGQRLQEKLYIFDFDATLFDTPSMETFNSVTNSQWKKVRPSSGPKSFIMSPCSLSGEMRKCVRRGPAFGIMKRLLKCGYRIAVLTGRASSLRSYVLDVLEDNDLSPNFGLITKPNNFSGTTATFKQQSVAQLVEQLVHDDPSVANRGVSVHFLDDLQANCVAVMQQTFADYVDLYVHGPDSQVFTSVLENTFPAALQKAGIVECPRISGLTDLETNRFPPVEELVRKVQNEVSIWWEEAAVRQNRFQHKWYTADAVIPFGSSALGRTSSDVDLCIVTRTVEKQETSDACVVLQEYLAEAFPEFEARHSGKSSCPRVACSLPLAKFFPGTGTDQQVQVDVVFVFVQSEAEQCGVNLVWDLDDYEEQVGAILTSVRQWDTPSIRAIFGVECAHRTLSSIAGVGISRSKFASLLECFLLALRSQKAFNTSALRTFQIVHWLTLFLEYQGKGANIELESLFRGFLHFSLHEMDERSWSTVRQGYPGSDMPLVPVEEGAEILEVIRSIRETVGSQDWDSLFCV